MQYIRRDIIYCLKYNKRIYTAMGYGIYMFYYTDNIGHNKIVG